MTECRYFPHCSGCSLLDVPYLQQKDSKISYLRELLIGNSLKYDNEIEFISLGQNELRHRVDFTLKFNPEIKQHEFGFYDKNKNLIHITECLQLSPELQKVYSEFIKIRFFYGDSPVKKGSVRLRVGPEGIKGCWLDFSNIEIKHLLEDQKLLNDLLDRDLIVEIGQKGKKLSRINNQLKLTDPSSDSWFKTVHHNNEEISLKCLISDFTQPSWITAIAMVRKTLSWIKQHQDIKSVLEFGSGIGQFTLAFLTSDLKVEVCEISESSCEQLMLNAADYTDKLNIHVGDFHKKTLTFDHDLVFVNPARSGLKNFTDTILNSDAHYIIYISCFPESMVSDISKLKDKYSLCNIKIIDQFPQTEHFETFAVLKNHTKE